MPHRRDELLDGAITVLARGGSRALTHRAVEAAAEAPAGSTTNYFPTRDALLVGTLDHVLAAELSFYQDHARTGGDIDALTQDTATMVDHLVGPARERTTARLVLGLEAIWHEPLRAPYAQGRAVWRHAAHERCADIGLSEPDETAEALLALVDGLVVDRLRGDHTISTEHAVRPLLAGAQHSDRRQRTR